MQLETNVMGRSGQFHYFIGVVEDRQDPQKVGRVRVRVLGTHTENKALIPTNELHWAGVYKGLDTSTNGFGWSPVGLIEGEWVWGYFRDGESSQDPVVLGSMPGIPELAPNTQMGFNDPGDGPNHDLSKSPRKIRSRYYPNNGTGAQLVDEEKGPLYPRTDHPWGNVLGESDTNRLARGEKLDDTIIGVQRRQRDVHVPIAPVHPTPSRQWNEPASPAAPVYPYARVFEDESGNILEIDSTPGAERIHVYHRTGTRIEIDMEGNMSMKCVGKRYEVTMENSYSHFQNTMNLTVDGECNIYCRSNATLQVDGNLNVDVGGNLTEKVKGDYITEVGGSRTVKVKGSDQLDVGGNHQVHSDGVSDRHSGGPMYDIAGGAIKQSAGGTFTMASNGILSADGPAVYLNSQKGSTSSPTKSVAPTIPAFPTPLNQWIETANETGEDPVKEEK